MYLTTRQALVGLCSTLLALGTATTASALSYDFSTLLPDSTTPGETGPYARLTLSQDGPNTVDFQLEALGLAPTEFLAYLKFNVAGSATSPSFSVGGTTKTGQFESPDFKFKSEPKIDAGSLFDVYLEFSTSNSSGGLKRFTDGDVFSWSLSRTGFTVDDVDLPMLIHLQGIAGGGSAKIIATPTPVAPPPPLTPALPTPVPDGGSMPVLGGLGFLALRWFRSRRA